MIPQCPHVHRGHRSPQSPQPTRSPSSSPGGHRTAIRHVVSAGTGRLPDSSPAGVLSIQHQRSAFLGTPRGHCPPLPRSTGPAHLPCSQARAGVWGRGPHPEFRDWGPWECAGKTRESGNAAPQPSVLALQGDSNTPQGWSQLSLSLLLNQLQSHTWAEAGSCPPSGPGSQVLPGTAGLAACKGPAPRSSSPSQGSQDGDQGRGTEAGAGVRCGSET